MKKKPDKRKFGRIRGDSGQRRRVLIVSLLLGILAFIPVSVRLVQLMVVDYGYYTRLALDNQTRVTRVTGERGQIYDRNMNVLATNTSVEHVYLDPHELKQSQADMEKVSSFLAELLELDQTWVLEQGKDLTKRYKQVAAGVSTEIAEKIPATFLLISASTILSASLSTNTILASAPYLMAASFIPDRIIPL